MDLSFDFFVDTNSISTVFVNEGLHFEGHVKYIRFHIFKVKDRTPDQTNYIIYSSPFGRWLNARVGIFG